MTNFDYIMSKMTERNFADIFCNPDEMVFEEKTFGDKVGVAFYNWRNSINNNNSIIYSLLNGDKVPNVFSCNESYNNDTFKWECTGRKDSLSFQVWLSKPYNPEEWRDN